MLESIIQKFEYGKHTITLETGIIARQSDASVMAIMDDTAVFVTVVSKKTVGNDKSFLPLTVNYQERTYAIGRFPGSFFRREGKPNEHEILISRLIDRSLRPLFPQGFFHDIQIIATVVSINPQISPDIVAIIGSSAALSLSGIPFNGPIGIARIGYINNQYILNPTQENLKLSQLDLIITGTNKTITMIEASAKILKEKEILDAIIYGHDQQQIVINNINQLVQKVNKPKWNWIPNIENNQLKIKIYELAKDKLIDAYLISEKQKRSNSIEDIKNNILKVLNPNNDIVIENEIKYIFINLEKYIVRNKILKFGLRIDKRKNNEVRKIHTMVNILPRTHGSSLFTRGETQALVTVTLGTERDAQNIDNLIDKRIDRFLLHYNFPPYCTGEIGLVGFPKRREIGHGNLAKRGLLAVMPNINIFPYTIRVVSEITESNGSSSMATVCGASLALMDAGVPMKESVAGIAMGLIKDHDNIAILSDIIGDEDGFGDMDFKIIGSSNGITACQMDVKKNIINHEMIALTLNQAKYSLIYILDQMKQTIFQSRDYVSKFAPCINIIKIDPKKIKDIIGKGGVIIRSLIEKTKANIEIEDSGIITISADENNKINNAIQCINEIITEIEVGKTYLGKITRIVDFGVFVTFKNNKEGLVHISQISMKRIDKIVNHLKLGQDVYVKVLEIDHQNRIRLSIKDAN